MKLYLRSICRHWSTRSDGAYSHHRMSIVLQLRRRRNQQAHLCLSAQPPFGRAALKLVVKMLTKKVCNSHLIPMARWVCTCSPWGRHVPQNILIKPGKKPCLIWDGSNSHVLVRDLNEHGYANGTGDGDHIWHHFHRSLNVEWLQGVSTNQYNPKPS